MANPSPILKNIRESAGIQLAVLFGSFFILLLLTTIIGGLVLQIPGIEPRSATLIASAAQALLAFCIPAFLLARFSSNQPAKWLYLNNPPKLKAIAGVVIVYLISLPVMEWLIELNQNMHLPDSMASLEATLRSWEDNSEQITKTLLQANGFMPIMTGVLVIGVLTGFAEELFFRGGLQGIFSRGRIGQNGAVWVAAFLFSTMHFQFFGFLPRLLMGAFFGYLLVWTRSIWVPVFAHVLNNSIVVISESSDLTKTRDVIDNGSFGGFTDHYLVVTASLIATVLFFILFRGTIFKEVLWRKKQLPPALER